jgi:hypothetical protein
LRWWFVSRCSASCCGVGSAWPGAYSTKTRKQPMWPVLLRCGTMGYFHHHHISTTCFSACLPCLFTCSIDLLLDYVYFVSSTRHLIFPSSTLRVVYAGNFPRLLVSEFSSLCHVCVKHGQSNCCYLSSHMIPTINLHVNDI